MYNASPEFLGELKQNSRIEHLRGTIGGKSFSDENILSMNYTNRCSDTKEVSFGLAYVGQIQISLCDIDIPRGSWNNLRISLQYGLDIFNGTEAETVWVPVGVFYVSEALWTDTCINITANDAMTKFDKLIVANEITGAIYSFLNWACSMCGVTFGMTPEECAELPNGNEFLGLYPESDIQTYRDLIGWCAQTVGGFATIDRNGALVVRSWASSSIVDTFTAGDRIVGSSFSDFETNYAGISIVNMEEKTTSYYGQGDGVVINLGSNPLLQFGTAETKDRQRNALRAVAQGCQWTPFRCSLISNPIYDLGDLISMTGGVAGDDSLTCCIMSINWTPKGLTEFQGYGSDPALASGKSKTDKNIAGLSGSTNTDKLSVVHYVNADAYAFESEWVRIARLRIGVANNQIAQLFGVIRLNMSSAGIVRVRYLLNSDYLPFIHVCQFPVGLDTITLYLPIALTNIIVNQLDVEIMSDDGTGIIAVDNVQIGLQGVGVTSGEWDGYIDAADSYFFPFQNGIGFNYEDEAEVTTSSSILPITARDTAAFPLQAGLVFGYAETNNTRITMEGRVFRITTEDGRRLATEDGQNIITEE